MIFAITTENDIFQITEKEAIFLNGSKTASNKVLAENDPRLVEFSLKLENESVRQTLFKRQNFIAATDPFAIRHMRQELRFTAPEMEALAKQGKALTTAQFKELEAYTQALRDLPTTLKTWPAVADSDWPKNPAFMDKPSTQGV
jgi:hypothetical protein